MSYIEPKSITGRTLYEWQRKCIEGLLPIYYYNKKNFPDEQSCHKINLNHMKICQNVCDKQRVGHFFSSNKKEIKK